MIIVKLCFAAMAVVRDAETSSISAFNIFEGIVPAGLPVFMQHASFFVLWERELADPQQIRGVFSLEIGEQLLTRAEVNLDFGGRLLHRSIVNMQGVAVPRPGKLHFRIVLDGGSRAEYSMDVTAPPAIVQAFQ
jgi:hypothetical protein